MTELLIDGAPPTTDDLVHQALINYGAYTSFRVENGAVRGLDLHLARLEQAAVDLFGESPGETELRRLIAYAVSGSDACWVRVSLFAPQISHRAPSFIGRPKVMTVVSPPPPPLATSVRLTAVPYAREAAHLKHAATFGLTLARRAVRAGGFDDALFVDGHGCVSEGVSWNIGFIQGDHIVWPQAPMLAGVAQALIERGLGSVGLTSSNRPVTTADLVSFDAAFICNSATPACPVTAIDAVTYAPAPAVMARLAAAAGFEGPQPLETSLLA